MSSGSKPPEPQRQPAVGGRYSYYALGVLVLVYVFNFIDRQIIAILAEEIKRDIGITDAQIGFLYGTAFAVFYAVFGIPLGRLADVWVRRKLIAVGLAFWSLMTALSGSARSFAALGTFRVGVGVGEASASPAAYSMLSDYFPPAMRATVISLYSGGVFIGAGIGIFLGGWIVEGWREAFGTGAAPLGLKGWQAAYIAVGLPGLLMALWVWTLREPARGQSEGLTEVTHPDPFGEFWRELLAVLPPFTLWSLYRNGAGVRGVIWNAITALAIIALAVALVRTIGGVAQWTALGIGVYSAISWAHGLAFRDPPTFAMIFRSRALLLGCFGFAWIGFVTYGLGFWMVPYFLRVHGASEAEVGTYIGVTAAVAGWLGVTSGGLLSDWLKARTPNARIYVGLIAIVLSLPLGLSVLTTENVNVAYAVNFVFTFTSSMWAGSAAAFPNDLVMPRMRAIVSAFYIMLVTFIGLALGPYTVGQISDRFFEAGASSGEALRQAMFIGLGGFAVAAILLLVACRYASSEEASRLERARAAGEPDL